MLNCDRCGLYSAGQSSICEISFLIYTREDYESLNETEKLGKRYAIISGYNSCYDSLHIILTGDISTEKELRERHPWITEIGEHVDNLCDDCIEKMLRNKEAIQGNNDVLFAPFYTSCCNKLFLEEIDSKEFYDVREEITTFPYVSYLKIFNWSDILANTDKEPCYIKEEDAFFSYSYSFQCVICKDCFNCFAIDKIVSDIPKNLTKKYFPYRYTLAYLRSKCEMYVDFPDRGKELTLTGPNLYDPRDIQRYKWSYYYYLSKKNNLLLKKKLSLFIAKRNLSLLRNHFPISNDVISSILKHV